MLRDKCRLRNVLRRSELAIGLEFSIKEFHKPTANLAVLSAAAFRPWEQILPSKLMMKMLRTANLIIAFIAAVGILVPGMAEARGKTDQVRVTYIKPKNPAHEPLVEFLKRRNFHGRLRRFLSPVKLSRKLTFELKGCDGELNAEYDSDEGTISVCYDYLDYMQKLSKQVPSKIGISEEAALAGAAFDLLLHEFGHAAFDLLKVPFLGREEDAADFFSAYIMLQFAPKDAYALIASTAYVSATEARAVAKPPSMAAYAKEHSLPEQRYFNLLCLAYGADPKAFKPVLTIGNLPADRAEGCADEYRQVQFAFRKLIKPHIDQSLARKIRKTKWFNF